MKQHYLISFLLICFLCFTVPTVAQDTTRTGNNTELPIDGLSIYPNPVTGGKVYISTSLNQEKAIEIYNVLGKPIHKVKLRGKELDISSLNPGIYILKIKENDKKATRKLVVK